MSSLIGDQSLMKTIPAVQIGCRAAMLLAVLLAAGPMAAGLRAADDTRITLVNVPPVEAPNAFYAGNRAPLLASPLVKLPIGNIRPEGWLRKQLELMVDGMTGHLEEISQWCNFNESSWTNKAGEGKWPWEEMPYWIKGYGDLGYVLKDAGTVANATRWLKAIMASQREDGSFGPRDNFKNNDLWPHFCVLYALRSYYEATGDKQVIEVMTRYFKYVQAIPPKQLFTWDKLYGAGWWQWIRGADQLDSIHWLYNVTGEKWLLDLARVNHERTADWTKGVASWHGVNIAECWRGPAQFFVQSRDPAHLNASIRDYDEVRARYGQVPGGMYGADENCREGYTGPRQGTEACSFVEMMYSHEVLLKITGEVLWADRCEEVALNSLPPASTPDLKGLHYLTCPNQIQCDRQNKSPMIQNNGDMMTYTPYEQYRCCQHNIAMGWPYYAEHLWFATAGNGLAAGLYAASAVTAKVGDGTEVKITETTDYPFSDTIDFTVDAPREVRFPLALRIPSWSAAPRIRINNKTVRFESRPGAWAVVDRTWKKGDVLRLRLPMHIRTRVWEKNHNAVSIERGPLTYSLRIGEKWQPYENKQKWAAFEVFASTPWNYGLVVDTATTDTSLRFVKREGRIADQPFTPEAAPVEIRARARRIPEWKQERNGLVAEIQDSPVRSEQPVEEITLIPMGCARLRITAFPQIGGGPDAKVWQDQPPRGAQTASWCNPDDTTLALTDGVLPANSGDTRIPRFTWWDHKGTEEWVEITLPAARSVDFVEVYWFDDSGAGQCRVPASWKLMYRATTGWKEVKATGPYGIEKDKFNKVAFEAVTADKFRVSARLREGSSAGILECRIGY
jgi:hypothetical protein